MQAAAQIRTFAMRGDRAAPVMVRAGHVAPSPAIAGLPDGDASLAHALAVLAACGLPSPPLAAIDIRPAQPAAWPGLDLPLAVALLVTQGRIAEPALQPYVLTAAISPDGHLAAVDGIGPIALQTAARGLTLLCADSQTNEAANAGGGDVIGAAHLAAVVHHLTGATLLAPVRRARVQAGMADGSAMSASLTPQAADPLMSQASDPDVAATPTPPFASTGPLGHRSRMRERVLDRGTASLADYELLEMLLFSAFRTGDTKPLAKRLINRFGSFAGVLAAPQSDLLAAPGLGAHAVSTLLVVRDAAERLSRAELIDRPLLNNWDRLIAYLNMVMVREPIEQFRVLYLDTRNRLLADEMQARGTVNHTPVYPREVLKRALEVQATALILVHNHPSGDPTPSTEDIEMTREVRKAATALGIVLHDHIIIGAAGYCSLRRELLL